MPSVIHETLIELFRARPELALSIVEEAMHIPLPGALQVTVHAADFGDVQPTEYRADLVLVMGAPEPVFGLVVEVQLASDARKPRRWLHYANTLAMRLGCPTAVLVVAPDDVVARWADREWDLGPGIRFRPLVLRNSDVPIVRDLAQAEANPELAVLSAAAHGRGDVTLATEIATAAALAVARVDGPNLGLYIDYIRASLSEAALRAFEVNMSVMDMKGYVPLSDWGKGHYNKGVAEGRREGVAEGRREGVAEGLTEGKAASVLLVLEARGVEVSASVRERILACRDVHTLDGWLRKAGTADSAQDLFSA